MPWIIKDWDKDYENASSRKIKDATWVPVPNKHDGRGLRRLLRLQNGLEVFGAWMLILQVASKMPVRGTLADSSGPLTALDIADKSGATEEQIQSALDACADGRIGWISFMLGESATTLGDRPTLVADADTSSRRVGPEQNRTEQNRKESKGTEGEGKEPSEPPAARPKLVQPMPDFEHTDGDVIVERILNVCMARHPIAGGRNLAREKLEEKLKVAPNPPDLALRIINAHEQFCEYWKTHPPDAKRLFAWWIRDEDYLSPPQAVLSPVLTRPRSRQAAIAAVFDELERNPYAGQ